MVAPFIELAWCMRIQGALLPFYNRGLKWKGTLIIGLFHLVSIHPLWMSNNYVWGGGGQQDHCTILITYRGAQDHY